MGNSALACACFGGPLSANDGAGALAEIHERALIVEIDAPAVLRRSKRMQLKIRAVNFHLLVQLPLGVLKQILLEYLRYESERDAQTSATDSEEEGSCSTGQEQTPPVVLTIGAPRAFNSFSINVSVCDQDGEDESAMEQKVLVKFKSDMRFSVVKVKQKDANTESYCVLQLQLCARCGSGNGCSCGWRSVHSVLKNEEELSLLEAIETKLPKAAAAISTAMAKCFHMRLTEVSRPPLCLEAKIFKKKIVHPMIERPYAVYTIGVCHGEMNWEVTRRYQDFAQLHMRLAEELAHDNLRPELPPTKWLRTLDDTFLLERLVSLNNYLKSVLMVESVHSSVPLLSFLGALNTTSVDHEALTLHRRDVLHLRVLSYYVAPGDLILFRSCGPVSGIQRSVTSSEWDHIGVVVPGQNPATFNLLEATGDGVSAFPLTSRLVAYSAFHIKYIALRKLRTPLITPSARFDLLRRFALEVEGSPYGLSVGKLLRTAASEAVCARDFFCSELAAEAFKALGVINPSITSSNFWPGSFASGGFVDAELARHGAALEPEVVVDCRLLEVAMAKKVLSTRY
ncbi:Wd repeat-containing protein 19 [Globisporangium polare]